MAGKGRSRTARISWTNPTDREQRIKDYVDLVSSLTWQRQGSFLAATVLGLFYFDPVSTVVCYLGVFVAEILDMRLGREAKAWTDYDPETGRRLLRKITVNTALSAVAISVFVINMAVQQTSGGHFTPLFFLFSASLFAAAFARCSTSSWYCACSTS